MWASAGGIKDLFHFRVMVGFKAYGLLNIFNITTIEDNNDNILSFNGLLLKVKQYKTMKMISEL